MDAIIEAGFLALVELKKEILTSKSNTKEAKDQRLQCWQWVADELLATTGKQFTSVQLQKKWGNIQQRLKDKTRDGKMTGGGPCSSLSENDKLTWRILGESNPKVSMIPRALHNSSSITSQLSVDVDEENESIPVITPKCTRTPAKRAKIDTDLDTLHKDVLLLQKEKLQLSIAKLKRDLVIMTNKSTQTETFTYLDLLQM